MITCIVTGGAGSGKSSFCKLLTDVGKFDFFSSDSETHLLLHTPTILNSLVTKFGAEILDPTGQLNRSLLRKIIFGSESDRSWLENLLHPLVFDALNNKVKEGAASKRKVLVAEVPLFYESQNKFRPTLTVLIGARTGLTQQRIVSNRGLSLKEATGIIKAQWPLERKMALTDVVIWNEGSAKLLEMQSELLIKQLDKEHVH
jgi:dephospho-CoA kinase